MGLATLIGRKYFTAEERETGKAALVMGCVGVTEGAIPLPPPICCASFRQYDWRRQRLRHRRADGRPVLRRLGGLIVLPVVQGKLGFVAALLVGACVSAACVILLKASPKETHQRRHRTMN